MNQNQMFTVAVRIFGVYLLVQAVMQIPTGVVDFFTLLLYWAHSSSVNPYAAATIYPAIFTAGISFVLFVAVGAYLLMAPRM